MATRTQFSVTITTIAPPQHTDFEEHVVAVEEVSRYYFAKPEHAIAFAEHWTARYKNCSPVVALHLPTN